MTPLKLLLISFTITLITLVTLPPAIAQPSLEVQHLQVRHTLTTKFNHYHTFTLADNLAPVNNFSAGLILSSPRTLAEQNSAKIITVVNKSNEFFNSAMVFHDKLNQVISYFTTPAKAINEQQNTAASDNQVPNKKCSSA